MCLLVHSNARSTANHRSVYENSSLVAFSVPAMRNLALLQTFRTTIPDESVVSSVAVDLDENVLYVATEQQTPDADVKVEVRKINGDEQLTEVSKHLVP